MPKNILEKINQRRIDFSKFLKRFRHVFHVFVISLPYYSKGYHWSGVSVAPIVKNIFERIIHLEIHTQVEMNNYASTNKKYNLEKIN